MNNNIVLVVDDDKSIRELLTVMLNSQNINVICAKDAIEALEIIKCNKIDLILLDIMMPKMDGMMACMKIRKSLSVPIIMLSSKIDDESQILGLTIGADDYISKPFNRMLLIAKIKSHLRRFNEFNSNSKTESNIIKIQDIIINLDKHQVSIDNNSILLTPREFDILVLLAQNKNNVLSIKQIYENIWNEPYVDLDRTVSVHIRKLRQKLKNDYIKTVWGVGYKIES